MFQIALLDVTLHLLPLPIDVLDEAVGNPVPRERLVGRFSEHRVPTKMGGCVYHWHRGLVTVDVVALAERVHDVQLQVGEGGQRDVDLRGRGGEITDEN